MAKCWAYNNKGVICGKPATGINKHGGYTCCQEHLDIVSLFFGPQPAPENPMIFNRPSNNKPLSAFFDVVLRFEDSQRRQE